MVTFVVHTMARQTPADNTVELSVTMAWATRAYRTWLRLWKYKPPTIRAQNRGDTWLGEIGMTSPAMAQQLAHKNMVRIINFGCV